MSDLISRLSDLRSQFNCFSANEQNAYHTLSEAIEALKERRTGKWTIEDVHSATYKYCCSKCKAHHRARYDFCPTCGAKMEVQND